MRPCNAGLWFDAAKAEVEKSLAQTLEQNTNLNFKLQCKERTFNTITLKRIDEEGDLTQANAQVAELWKD